jgi:hypothetical protein
MVRFEEHASLLLVLHTISGGLAVALSTHLVLWLRRLARGEAGRLRATRRFALLSTGAFALTMLLGLALYPGYRVRVRAELLENPTAIARGTELAAESRERSRERNRDSLRYRAGRALSDEDGAPAFDREALARESHRRIGRGARLARWFDVKEHWVAIGLLLSAAAALLLWAWPEHQKRRSPVAVPALLVAVGAAFTAWSAAIIGIVVAAARSVAGL